jgi:predicted kinase
VVQLIVLSGLPGTGKSQIADAIGRARRAPVLSVDPIESAILEAGIEASFETGLAAYVVAERVADASLAAGLDAVIDAVNSVDPARDMWRRLAAKHDVRLRIIECVLTDEKVHRRRLAGRDRGLRLAEPTWVDIERRRREWTPWPEPHLTLEATEPVRGNVERALAFLDAADDA